MNDEVRRARQNGLYNLPLAQEQGRNMNDEMARAEALTFALHDILDARTFEEAQTIARRAVTWPIDRVLVEHDRAVAEKAWDAAAELSDSDWFWHDGGRDMNPHRPLSVSTQKDADA